MNSLREIIYILGVQTRHADTAVLGHVDVSLVAQTKDLLLRQTCEAEHADLVGDVVPGSWSTELLKLGAQSVAHVLDTAGHGGEVLLPLSEQLGVVEDGAGDASAVQGRVGDLGALENSELRSQPVDGSGGLRSGSCDGVEATSTLTVETEVLGEALSDQELEALLDEVADGSSIAREAARSKALVGRVKEGEVLLGPDDLSKLLPLIESRVDSGRVVSAGVEENDGLVRRALDGSLHTLKVQPFGLLVEVRVVGGGKTDIVEDLVVVRPGGIRHVDGAVALEELGEEESAEVDGTGAGDSLD